MTATTTPQESPFQLCQSFTKELHHSKSDALPDAIASLGEKVQKASQCGHENESVNNSAQDISSEGGVQQKPNPFTGDASDYLRWKSETQEWANNNEAQGARIIINRVVQNLEDRAARWGLYRKIGHYEEIYRVSAKLADALEAIFLDTDELVSDIRAFENAGQGTKEITEHNMFFADFVVGAGYDFDSSRVIIQYIESLRTDLLEKVADWQYEQNRLGKPASLADCMRKAKDRDAKSSSGNKRRRRGSTKYGGQEMGSIGE